MSDNKTPVNAPVLKSGHGKQLRRLSASCGAGTTDITTVEPKTAAFLMAIVADELQIPLNELRFLSIKEVRTRK